MEMDNRIEMYHKKYKMPLEAAKWAAEHENMLEFRELKFVTDNYTIMPKAPRKRESEAFENLPLPGWLNAEHCKKLIRYYWVEHLSVKDCASLANLDERYTKDLLIDLKLWAKAVDHVECSSCKGHFFSHMMLGNGKCGTCFAKEIKELYK